MLHLELVVDLNFSLHCHRPDVRTYEWECTAHWLRTKQTEPISNTKLPNKKLVPNFALRARGRSCYSLIHVKYV